MKNNRNAFKHGMSFTPTHQAWTSMKARCSNPNNPMFKHYGGRGITVCERWLKFANFFTDMGEVPGVGMQLERKDNNAGYAKTNCIWADRTTQANNTRVNHTLTFRGVTQTVAQWARQVNLAYNTLHGRLYAGWPVERALITPTGPQRGRDHKRNQQDRLTII